MSKEELRETRAQEESEITSEITEESLNELRKIRRDKLKALQEAGRNPFLIEKWDVTAHSMDIKDNFDAMEDQEVSCAGRIMAFRNMGKASFFDKSFISSQYRISIFLTNVKKKSETVQPRPPHLPRGLLFADSLTARCKAGFISDQYANWLQVQPAAAR